MSEPKSSPKLDPEKMAVWVRFRLEKVGEIFRTCHRIIDFGNSSRELADLFADELRDKERISADINLCYRPDVVADICRLPFKDESIDGVICAAILEHVYDPFSAAAELYRTMKPQGKMFVYVPWMFNYHAAGREYRDYYRFSRDGVRHLFRDFSHVELKPVRGRIETTLNFISMTWLGKASLFHRLFGRLIRKVDQYGEKYTSGFNVFIVK